MRRLGLKNITFLEIIMLGKLAFTLCLKLHTASQHKFSSWIFNAGRKPNQDVLMNNELTAFNWIIPHL
jgi:hypothetical protein